MKKIAIVITRMIPGGASSVARQIIDGLKDEFDFTLFSGIEDISAEERDELEKKYKAVFVPFLVRQISPLNDIRAYLDLERQFRTGNFDIVHTHTSKAGVLGAFAGRMAGVGKIIYTPHGHIFGKNAAIPGLENSSRLKMKFLLELRKRAYSACDRIVALSEQDRDEQVALGLAQADKFEVIMNGIDDSFFAPVEAHRVKAFKERHSISDDDFVIGSVGRLSKEKGHDLLIEAFAKIADAYPSAKLLLVGDGAEKKKLMAAHPALGDAGRVIFAGSMEDVRPALAAMKIFVLPSRYESQGIAAMEAMASGLPVVASDVGGVRAIINDGQDGLLARSSPGDLTDKIAKLLHDANLRDKLSASAMRRAKADFTLSRMLSQYEKLYL